MTTPTAYPLAWPDGWPRSKNRRAAAFKVTLDKAVRELEYEITRMGGRYPLLSCNVRRTMAGALSALGKPENGDPGVAVYFERQGKQMVFACDRWYTVRANVRSVSKTIEALRGIERWGASDMMERALRAFLALPPPRAWNDILGLQPGASAAEIQAAHRRLTHFHHPDREGGSEARMAEINAARDEALKAPPP